MSRQPQATARPEAGRRGLISTVQSSAGVGPAEGSGGRTPRTWVLDPSGDVHYWWLSIMVVPILYNWIMLICRSCFPEVQQLHLALWLSLDYLSDLLYLLDIAVRLHTGFLEQGILVRDRARTARAYLRSAHLPWDVASVLPTDLLYLRLGLQVPAVRANRLLRTPRLAEALERRETRTARPHALRIARLMLCVLLAAHWHACAYYALSGAIGYGADAWVYPNHSRPGFARPLRQYLHSLHLSALVLGTVGDTPPPQRQEEFLFAAAGCLLAVLGFATVMGSMSSVVSSLSAAEAALYPRRRAGAGLPAAAPRGPAPGEPRGPLAAAPAAPPQGDQRAAGPAAPAPAAAGRAGGERAPGRPAQGAALPGLRAGPAGGAGAQAAAPGLQPGRVRLPQGRHRAGDVLRPRGAAGRGGRRRAHAARRAGRGALLRGNQHH
ncbi:unnamed protein product [Lepidochelys kempii]